jgi:hypothetical protein
MRAGMRTPRRAAISQRRAGAGHITTVQGASVRRGRRGV